MTSDKRNQLVKDIQEFQIAVNQLASVVTKAKDIDKAKALSLSISGYATGIQVALSEETSL